MSYLDIGFVDSQGTGWHIVPEQATRDESGCHLVRRGAYTAAEDEYCHSTPCRECKYHDMPKTEALLELERRFPELLKNNLHYACDLEAGTPPPAGSYINISPNDDEVQYSPKGGVP